MSRHTQQFKCSCNPLLCCGIKDGCCGQHINRPFFWMALEKSRQIRAANKFCETNKPTHCPNVRLPLLASFLVKGKADGAPHLRGNICNGINSPIEIQIPRRKPAGFNLLKVQQLMSNLMEQGVNVLIPGFVGID